jgi:hypothetical protein
VRLVPSISGVVVVALGRGAQAGRRPRTGGTVSWDELEQSLREKLRAVWRAEEDGGSGILICEVPGNRFLQYSRWFGDVLGAQVSWPEHVDAPYALTPS